MLVWFQKLINGAFLLLHREMRQQIPVALTSISLCSYMKEQSLLHEGAIDSTCRSNQLNSISLATKLMK
jgi:hypothetical protein